MEASKKGRSRRVWAWAGLGVVLTLLALLGLRRIPPDSVGVRELRLGTTLRQIVEPGWRWTPPLLGRCVSYPTLAAAEWALGDDPLVTRSGVRADVQVALQAQILPQRAIDFHRVLGPGWEDHLEREIRRLVESALYNAEQPFADGGAEVERYVRSRLEGILGLAGSEIRQFDVEVRVAQARKAGSKIANRVLLVGMDGLDWRVANPLIEQGRMPNLERIVREGAHGRLRTISPILSPVIWTSMVTGVPPTQHGILDFVTPGPDGKPIPITSQHRKVPALWNILTEADVSVGVVAWWATWPSESVNGAMVSDRVAYTLFGLDRDTGPPSVALTHPATLLEDLEPLLVDPQDIPVAELQRFIDLPGGRFPGDDDSLKRIDEMRRSLASTRSYESIAVRLLETRDLEFFAVYFEGPDVFSHLFMPFRPPQRAEVPAAKFEMFRRAVDESYAYHDEILGRLMEKVDLSRTVVVVVSDHGFRSDEHRPTGDARIGHGQAAEWHRKYGVVAMAGPGIEAGAEISEAGILDIPPTLMTILGLPPASDWPGVVLEEAFLDTHLQAHRVERIVSYGVRSSSGGSASQGQAGQQALLEKLAALGYLNVPDTKEPSEVSGDATPLGLNNRGSALMADGKFKEAESAFEKAIEAQPSLVAAWTNLAILHYLQGDLEKARTEFDRSYKLNPSSPRPLRFLGEIAAAEGRTDDAEQFYRDALELDPNQIDTLNSLGLLLERLGRFEEAREVWLQAVRVDPDFALAWNNLGNLAHSHGRAAEAEAHYREAIRADPTFIGSYNNLGLLLQDQGKMDAAVELYEEALDRVPGHPEVRNNLATLYHQLGRYDEAIQAYRSIIEDLPTYAEAYNNLGVLYGEMGDREEERAYYRRALEVRPDYADALHNLGLAFAREREWEQAERQFRKTLQIDPAYLSAWTNLAVTQLQRGAAVEAEETIRQGLHSAGEHPDLYRLQAAIHQQAGRSEASCRSLQRSFELAPHQPEIQKLLSDMGCVP